MRTELERGRDAVVAQRSLDRAADRQEKVRHEQQQEQQELAGAESGDGDDYPAAYRNGDPFAAALVTRQ